MVPVLKYGKSLMISATKQPILIALMAQLTRKENESFDRASLGNLPNPFAELTHSMQSLNTSVSFKCKVRLILWDVEERKSSHRSARCRKDAAPIVQQ